MKRHSRTPHSRKWQPKPGHMLFYNQEVPIAVAKAHAKWVLRGFDDLPRKTRDQINEAEPPARRRTTMETDTLD